jgi:hypothetical protein
LKNEHVLHRERRGLAILPVTIAVSAILLGSLFSPGISRAVSLSGDSRAYVQSREESDQSKILGGYEYLDVAIQKIGSQTISFHAGGWLRYDLREAQDGSRSNSDLQYSYLSLKSKTANTIVNLGRVMVFEGVAAERVDGLYARTELAGGFGLTGFGGVPVETGIDQPGNNSIYGGRLSHQVSNIYRLGLSALKEEKNSVDFRKESGIDLWVHPAGKVELAGRSSYNDITKGWMEHSYNVLLGPFAKLRLNTQASMISYDDYFFGITTRAFTLRPGTPGFLESHEKVLVLGEEVSYTLSDKVLLSADYKNYAYDIAGDADYYGARAAYRSAVGGAGIALHRMAGEADSLKYNEYRAYGYRKFGKFDVVVDAIDISYAAAIQGVKHASSASLAAQYDMATAWKLGADVEYSRTPDFDRDIRTFFKVLYSFGAKGGA